MQPRRVASAVVSAVLLAALAACGSDRSDGEEGGALAVVAAFYPLEWMAERIGGAHVEVESLTGTGQEPHDLELAPGDVATVVDADAVVYLDGFQPAVDDAVDQASPERVFDAAPSADLDLEVEGVTDPHFWLDPVRFAAVATAFADVLSERDPAHAADFAENRDRLRSQLSDLDADLREGLASCDRDALVTTHGAFGYLAARYGLDQVGIAGLSPEAEPSPADLARVARFVEDNDVRTIYFETLASSDVAEAVASEAGARTAVLDPIEGLTDASAGDDYLEVMRANLDAIRAGQPCS